VHTGAEGGLKVDVESDWACAWVKVAGAIDASTAPYLLSTIDEVLAGGPRKVHLLLRSVDGIEPSAVAVLDTARRQARSRGIRIVLHCPRRLRVHAPSSRWVVHRPRAAARSRRLAV
jgi:anti-anti-sigma factor